MPQAICFIVPVVGGRLIQRSGRSGAVQRGEFQMYPATWTTLNYGAFSGPAVADGKVYLSVLEAVLDDVRKDARYAKDIYIKVGADPRVRAEAYGLLRDANRLAGLRNAASRMPQGWPLYARACVMSLAPRWEP